MEFPTALLGVALGVVLTSQLTAARASGDEAAYSVMLDDIVTDTNENNGVIKAIDKLIQ